MSQRITSTKTELLFGAQTHMITDFDRHLVFYFTLAMMGSALTLFFLPAPYGKFNKSMDFVPLLSKKISWKWSFAISESPALLVPLIVTVYYHEYLDPLYLLFLGLYELHYIHRLILYPFFRVRSNTPSTVIIALMSFLFQSINGYLMSKFALFLDYDPVTILKMAAMLFGLCLFSIGAFVNCLCDQNLISLRKTDRDPNYYLPKGLLFNLVSCPNYLAEILEWTGILLAYPSPATLSFVVSCCANLVPRAYSTHNFYRQKFGDKYPKNRKAIIPFVF